MKHLIAWLWLTSNLISTAIIMRNRTYFSYKASDLGFSDDEINVENDPRKPFRHVWDTYDRIINQESVPNSRSQGRNDSSLHFKKLHGEKRQTFKSEKSFSNYDDVYLQYIQNARRNLNHSALQALNNLESRTKKLNCSGDVGIGSQAISCVMKGTTVNQKEVLIHLLLIWSVIVLGIIILLWCSKGWCCCCCPFGFCQVESRLNKIRRFLVNYPPGRRIVDDEIEEYEPTAKEVLLYEMLTDSFLNV